MKNVQLFVLASLLFGLGFAALAEETVWQLSYAKTGVLADVRLNGYPLYRFTDTGDNSAAMMIGPWLRSGRNELSVQLLPKKKLADSEAENAAFGPELHLSLFTMDRAIGFKSRNELFHLNLPLNKSDTISLPYRLDFSIFIDNPPASQLWELAEPLTLNTELKDEGKALMARAYAALKDKDTEAYFELYKFAMEDMYQAYGWSSPDLLEKIKSGLPELFKSKDFKYEAGNPEQLLFETMPGSGNRLIAVRTVDGQPVINAGLLKQDVLFLARINGALTIVRN